MCTYGLLSILVCASECVVALKATESLAREEEPSGNIFTVYANHTQLPTDPSLLKVVARYSRAKIDKPSPKKFGSQAIV